jgi:SepF-like predicted cell division protein (DUF552 family)
MSKPQIWKDKAKEIVRLCKERGFSKEEYLIICSVTDADSVTERFSEIEALEIVAKAIKRSHSWEEAMRNVVKDLDAFDVNARPDIIIEP